MFIFSWLFKTVEYFRRNIMLIDYIVDKMNANDYVIAIPSKGRAKMLNDKTLTMLKKGGINPRRIHIFVTEDEYDTYKSTIERSLYGFIIKGVPGIVAQRKFIENYFNTGDKIISMDDDLDELDLSFTNFKTYDEFFNFAFKTIEDDNSYIWGVYPAYNEFFRRNKPLYKTGLLFIIGHLYGFINRPGDKDLETRIAKCEKEDFERSLNYFLKDGSVVRFENVAAKTLYCRGQGGLGKLPERLAGIKEDCKTLADTYPHLIKLKEKKSGKVEIIFTEQKKKQIIEKPFYIQPIEKSEFEKIEALLNEISIPFQAGSSGRARTFGKHRACTFGLIKPRGKKQYVMSAASVRHPEVHDELMRLGEKFCPVDFTSIHINHNVVCPRHIDPKNVGNSMIVSIGDYEGGELVVEGVETYNAKYHPLIFNGALFHHWNNPITSGNKYSLIFFNQPAPKEQSETI